MLYFWIFLGLGIIYFIIDRMCTIKPTMDFKDYVEGSNVIRGERVEKPTRRAYNSYNEYLKSNEWKEKKLKALQRAEYKCQLCGSVNCKLNVHHNTYRGFNNERESDLICLCSQCHKAFHGINTPTKAYYNSKIS